MKTLGILIIFLFSSPAIATSCSCLPRTIRESFNSADLIFKGKVVKIDTLTTLDSVTAISIEPDGSERGALVQQQMIEVQFRITQTIKGVENPIYISVFTKYGCCNCGFPFQTNMTYIVYANSYMATVVKSKTLPHNQFELEKLFTNQTKIFSTSTCTRTTEQCDVELKEINAFLKSQKSDSR